MMATLCASPIATTRTDRLAGDVTPPPIEARRRPATVAGHTGNNPELTAPATTEQLLHDRNELPPGHPARAVLRTRAIEENMAVARRLARRYAGRGEPLDDLVQVAALALVRAVDGYDCTRGSSFISYATPTIVGSLKRHFRDTAWTMRVPRSAQERVLATRTASSELAQRLGRTATPTELAEHLHDTVDHLLDAWAAMHAYRPESLEAAQDRSDANLLDVLGSPDPHFVAVDDALMLRALVGALPDRERRILILRFYDDKTQSQIATEMGVSQMHVSRLLRQALARLRVDVTSSGASGPARNERTSPSRPRPGIPAGGETARRKLRTPSSAAPYPTRRPEPSTEPVRLLRRQQCASEQ